MASIVTYVSRPSPKQSGIVEDIRRRIISGEYAPGAQLPTIAQMQQRHGASPVTVRRAVRYLRERGFIRTEERSGMYVAEEPPCLCNLGLVLPFYNYTSQFLTALENEARRLSETEPSPSEPTRRFSFFNEIDGPSDDTRQHHADLFEAVETETVGGLIFAGYMGRFAETPVVQNPHVPCVAMTEFPLPGIIAFRLTGFVEKAVDLLAARGRRRIALITRGENAGSICEAFASLVEEHGMTTHPWWIHGVYAGVAGWARNCTELLLHSGNGERPDAIIIADDNLVPAATAGVAAAGVRVPDDADVVAHTNFPWPTPAAVPVSRVGYDIRHVMRMAVDVIERKRRGEQMQDEVTLMACLEAEALVSDASEVALTHA